MQDRQLLMIPGPIEFTPEVLRGGLRHVSHGPGGTRQPGADILATVGSIEHGLARTGYSFTPGVGLAAAQAVLLE